MEKNIQALDDVEDDMLYGYIILNEDDIADILVEDILYGDIIVEDSNDLQYDPKEEQDFGVSKCLRVKCKRHSWLVHDGWLIQKRMTHKI